MTLLCAIGGVGPFESNLITFNVGKAAIRLSHQISFQITMHIFYVNIHFNLVDEGSATCACQCHARILLALWHLPHTILPFKALTGTTLYLRGFFLSSP